MPLSPPFASERPSATPAAGATLIPFPVRAPAPSLEAHRARARLEQKRLLDLVFAGDGLEIAAEDVRLKAMAARLQILGFVAVDEVGEGGALRRLRASETIEAEPGRAWRLSRAAGAAAAL